MMAGTKTWGSGTERHLAVHDLLCRFFLAFDEKDWPTMLACLSEEVHVDYASSGREPASTMPAADFIDQRRNQKDDLLKQHNFSNLRVVDGENGLEAACNYQIYRFQPAQAGEGTLHSFGRYVFGIAHDEGQPRINRIVQHLMRSVGQRSLHAGSRNAQT